MSAAKSKEPDANVCGVPRGRELAVSKGTLPVYLLRALDRFGYLTLDRTVRGAPPDELVSKRLPVRHLFPR